MSLPHEEEIEDAGLNYVGVPVRVVPPGRSLPVPEEIDIAEGIKTHNVDKSEDDSFLERAHRTTLTWERDENGTPIQIERAKTRADYQSKLERILNLCDDEKRLDHMQFNTRNKLGHQAKGDIDINGFKYTLTDRFVGDLDRAIQTGQRQRRKEADEQTRLGVGMFQHAGGAALLFWARQRLTRERPDLSQPVEMVCFHHEKIRNVAPQLRVSRDTVERRVHAGLDQLDAWVAEVLDAIFSAE